MDERELSALIDELLAEKRAKHPAEDTDTAEETALSEEIAELAEEAAEMHSVPAPHAAPELAEELMPQPEVQTEDEPAAVPDAEARRSRLYAALDAQPEPEAEEPVRQFGHRTRDVIAGLVLVVLAVYGAIALVQRGIARAEKLADHSAAEDAVKKAVLPLVLTDMPDFADPSELSDDQFMTAAIWAVITQGKLADYPQSFEMYSVPAEALIAAGNRLFAVNRSPECRTIGFSGELRFYYDAEAESYLLPADPELFTYEPLIRETAEQPDGLLLVTVDYAAEQPAWNTGEPRIIKTVQFLVQEQEGAHAVRAARQISEQEEGTS